MFTDHLLSEISKIFQKQAPVNLADREQFVRNLRVVYHIIRATEPLLAQAYDYSLGPLREFYRIHLKEEKLHAEWAYRDLALLLKSEKGIFPCPPIAAQFAGSQYYHLMHTGVASLLGYMVVLEGFPPSLETVEKLEDIYGKECCANIRHHAEHDPRHFSELAEIVEILPPADKAMVKQVALETAELFLKVTDYVRG